MTNELTGRVPTATGAGCNFGRARTLTGSRGRPEDVAAAVRFLCGPAAGYITARRSMPMAGPISVARSRANFA